MFNKMINGMGSFTTASMGSFKRTLTGSLTGTWIGSSTRTLMGKGDMEKGDAQAYQGEKVWREYEHREGI